MGIKLLKFSIPLLALNGIVFNLNQNLAALQTDMIFYILNVLIISIVYMEGTSKLNRIGSSYEMPL